MKRSKRRYLLLQIDVEGSLNEREFLDAIWGSIARMYGESGASLANMSLIKYDEEKKSALIRVSLSALQSVRASLALITRISDRSVAVQVIKISGTIKSLGARTAQ